MTHKRNQDVREEMGLEEIWKRDLGRGSSASKGPGEVGSADLEDVERQVAMGTRAWEGRG